MTKDETPNNPEATEITSEKPKRGGRRSSKQIQEENAVKEGVVAVTTNPNTLVPPLEGPVLGKVEIDVVAIEEAAAEIVEELQKKKKPDPVKKATEEVLEEIKAEPKAREKTKGFFDLARWKVKRRNKTR